MRFRVVGRSDDMVVIRGLNIFPTMIASVVNQHEELTGDYRIVLDTKPPYDVLPVQVELAPGYENSRSLAETVSRAIKSALGASATVSVLPTGGFPKTEGKTKRVIRNY